MLILIINARYWEMEILFQQFRAIEDLFKHIEDKSDKWIEDLLIPFAQSTAYWEPLKKYLAKHRPHLLQKMLGEHDAIAA